MRNYRFAIIVCSIFLILTSLPFYASAGLEIPETGSIQAGVGSLHGWDCSVNRNTEVIAVVDGGLALFPLASGIPRNDTIPICSRSDTGYSSAVNWNLLGHGWHIVDILVNGIVSASAEFFVVTQGVEFKRDVVGSCKLSLSDGTILDVEWSQSRQNVTITNVNECSIPEEHFDNQCAVPPKHIWNLMSTAGWENYFTAAYKEGQRVSPRYRFRYRVPESLYETGLYIANSTWITCDWIIDYILDRTVDDRICQTLQQCYKHQDFHTCNKTVLDYKMNLVNDYAFRCDGSSSGLCGGFWKEDGTITITIYNKIGSETHPGNKPFVRTRKQMAEWADNNYWTTLPPTDKRFFFYGGDPLMTNITHEFCHRFGKNVGHVSGFETCENPR